MDYDFSRNLRRTIDFSSENFKEFFKTDVKYLFIPISILILLFFGVFSFFLVPNIQLTTASVRSFIVITFLVSIGIIIWLSYITTWLTQSKSYYFLNKFSNPKLSYEEVLFTTKKYRLRVFIGTLINALISLSLIGLLYIGFILSMFVLFSLVINSPSITLIVVLITFFILYLILILYSLFKLIPLQLYPTVLINESNIGYSEGLKRTFQILPGWKNKIKFVILQLLLSYIVSFVAEMIFLGLFFGTFIVLVIFAVLIKASGNIAIFILLGGILISFGVYMIGIIEAENIVIGTFYGQSYVNLARPDLFYDEINKEKINKPFQQQGLYCTNCGLFLTLEQNFCPNCGKPVEKD